MLNLLEIGQAVAIKARIKVPGTLVSNPEKNARVILLCIQEAAEELVREYNWTQLISKHTLTANYGKSSYPLDEDFDRIVDDTVWSAGQNSNLTGPVGYDDWQYIELGITSPNNNLFSLSNATKRGTDSYDTIEIFSISDSNEISFYWVSKYHAWNPTSPDPELVTQEYYERDTDESVVDSTCIKQLALAKTLQALGMSYQDEQGKYEDMMKERVNRDRGSSRVSMNARRPTARRGRRNWRRGGCGDPILVNLPVGGWR